MIMADSMLLFQQLAAAKVSSSAATGNSRGKTSGGQDAKGDKTSFQDLLEKKSGSQPPGNKDVRDAAVSQENGKAELADQDDTALQELAAALIAQPPVLPQTVVTEGPPDIQVPEGLAQTVVADQGTAVLQQTLSDAQTTPQPQDGLLLKENPGDIPAEVKAPVAEPGKSTQSEVQLNLNLTEKNTGVSVQQVQAGDEQEAGEEKTFQVVLEQSPQPLFENTDSIPVKVGENAPLDTESSDFGENLAGQLDQALNQGEQKLTLRLSPESLGPVTVEMTRAGDGSLHVVLHASTEKASNLLTEHAAELGSLLQSSNRSPVQVAVYRQEENHGYQQQYQDAQSGGNGQGSQQQRERRYPSQEGQDFMQRLRLGLIIQDGEAV